MMREADELYACLPDAHPDGTQVLRRANSELSKTATEFKLALTEFSQAASEKAIILAQRNKPK
jgi:hypothetical protein